MSEFPCRDLGTLTEFIGTQIRYSRSPAGKLQAELHMERYMEKLSKKYGLSVQNKQVTKPLDRKYSEALLWDQEPKQRLVVGGAEWMRQVLGSTGFAATLLRPDLAFAQGHLQRFITCCTEDVRAATKNYLQYAVNTPKARLVYWELDAGTKFELSASADSDWKGCAVSERSTGGHLIMLNGMIIHWMSRMLAGKRKLSSTEAEFMQLNNTCNDVIFFRNCHDFCAEQGGDETFRLREGPIEIEQDNQGSKDNAEGAGGKSLRYLRHQDFYARDCVESGEIKVRKVSTLDIAADLCTKPAKSGNDIVKAFEKYNFRRF